MGACLVSQDALACQASPQGVCPEWVFSTTDVHFLSTLKWSTYGTTQFLKPMLKWKTLELKCVLDFAMIKI